MKNSLFQIEVEQIIETKVKAIVNYGIWLIDSSNRPLWFLEIYSLHIAYKNK